MFEARRGPGRGGSSSDAPVEDPDVVDSHGAAGPWWRCAVCDHRIALDRRRRGMPTGADRQTFVNPAGIVYEITGFCEAPGCLPHGQGSDYWSWFPGYAWQVVSCRGCGGHLGWLFRGGGDSFFGLIAARLVLSDDDHPT